jgi:hypothetical protein
MYNTGLYNTALYNTLFSFPATADREDIEFDGYGLQNSNICVSKITYDNAPDRDYQTSAIPRGNGLIENSDYWRRKTIVLTGTARKDTRVEFDALIDEMKKELSGSKLPLNIRIGAEEDNIRSFESTLQSINFKRESGYVTFCPFEATFLVLTPFGTDIDYTSDAFLGTTDLTFTEEIEVGGTVQTPAVIILNFISASSVSVVNIVNNTTGEEIEITASISAGGYLKIDGENREVTLNGVSQDFDGIFPNLSTGINNITITITGSSATYDLTIKRLNSYL